MAAPAAVPVSPVAAAPSSPGDEGGKSLREVFEAASKGHIEATNKLEKSKKRQSDLGLQLELIEARVQSLSAELGTVAAESYRLGRLTPMSMLLNSASPDAFLERAAGLDVLAQRDGRKLRELIETRDQADRAKAAIDNEVKEQKKQLAVIAKKKQDAERALATVGGSPSGGFINANSPLAKPAPRNSDGSWPNESCTIDDPTTGGCITPRTLHAYNQARAAGFKRHTSCHRSGGGGEHPKGQACDFSSGAEGFKNSHATGGDRTYGNNLASFYIKNANRLGVLYVIWYRQIWMPGTGWRSYSGGSSPAGAHTNHVHLSMI
ncbi:hypothetical protein O7627_03340 [Solwaraspora sp. WMMD1047]|uniref:coiled-coil domain-containing protein n=1 Tax=Solwaraspora sp. WMMD1047 TaxID=3016102 RepID=UPI002416F33B|nr:hypothetical protein [Solwaraspora sp. WMMD1047]MDG4828338.1 hypothetical protein [Solwaraspora sp. WMMD1047]